MDIAITGPAEAGREQVLAVIECKELRISVIAQQVIDQAAAYARLTGARCFILTNSLETYAYRCCLQTNTYTLLQDISSYQDMMKKRPGADESEKMDRLLSKQFCLSKDFGVQYLHYSGASGGGFGSGYYRCLLLLDTNTRL